jgi:hypothetical protein
MKKNKLIYPVLSAITVTLSTSASYALSVRDIKDITLEGGILSVTNAILALVGIVAVLFLIIGGFRYVTASGNPEQIEGAKKTIMYAVVGLIVVILAYAIVNYIIGKIV